MLSNSPKGRFGHTAIAIGHRYPSLIFFFLSFPTLVSFFLFFAWHSVHLLYPIVLLTTLFLQHHHDGRPHNAIRTNVGDHRSVWWDVMKTLVCLSDKFFRWHDWQLCQRLPCSWHSNTVCFKFSPQSICLLRPLLGLFSGWVEDPFGDNITGEDVAHHQAIALSEKKVIFLFGLKLFIKVKFFPPIIEVFLPFFSYIFLPFSFPYFLTYIFSQLDFFRKTGVDLIRSWSALIVIVFYIIWKR